MSKLLSVHRALSIVFVISAASACSDISTEEEPNNVTADDAGIPGMEPPVAHVDPHEDAGMHDAAMQKPPVGSAQDAATMPPGAHDAALPMTPPADAGTSTSDAGPTLPMVVADGTFASVFTVLSASCAGCHGAAKPLDFSTPALAHASLVNAPASMKACAPVEGAEPWMRVVPGDLEQSLMIQKLEGRAPCGNQMPIKLLLPQDLVEVFRAWVSAGAPSP